MYPELTNLLPADRIALLRREYFIRLCSVGIGSLVVVVVAAGALLVPSYLYLNQEIQTRQDRLTQLSALLATSKGAQANQQLAALANSTAYLARLASTTAASASVNAILSVPHGGIQITAISMTPASRGASGKMTLSGIAATRESLQAYNNALQALPYISNVDLPISSFAKDSSIPFTITLTGTLAP